jgi:hypothetical protein
VETPLAKQALETAKRRTHARRAHALGRQAAMAKGLLAAADLDR